MVTEWTYLMLLSKLLEDVGNNNTIPHTIKECALNKIDELQKILEDYSA